MHDNGERKYMGKKKEGAIIPVAPPVAEVDNSYISFIENIKSTIKS